MSEATKVGKCIVKDGYTYYKWNNVMYRVKYDIRNGVLKMCDGWGKFTNPMKIYVLSQDGLSWWVVGGRDPDTDFQEIDNLDELEKDTDRKWYFGHINWISSGHGIIRDEIFVDCDPKSVW